MSTQGLQLLPRKLTKNLDDLMHVFDIHNTDLAKQQLTDMSVETMDNVHEEVKAFRLVGRAQSETFAYWDRCLEGISLLLRLLRAEREGDFLLHLDAVCEALP